MGRSDILPAIAALMVALLLTGCKAQKETVTLTEIRTDTVTQFRIVSDTVRERIETRVIDQRYDSIAPVIDSFGRVIAFDRWHYRTLTSDHSAETARLRATIDSLRTIRADTLIRIEQRPVEVEKRLSASQRIRMTLGDIATAALALWLAAIAIRRYFR